MKTATSFFISLLFICSLFSQEQYGLVREQNSNKQTLSNVQVTFVDAVPTTSDSKGTFKLAFDGKSKGDRIFFEAIQKKGYELVNEKEIQVLKIGNNNKLPKDIILAKNGTIEAARKKYFGISDEVMNKNFNKEYEFIIPLRLTVKNRSIKLFAIWAMPHKSNKKLGYVGQIWRAMNYYLNLLDDDSIIVGDFNSNTFWDKLKRVGTHSELVALLATKNIKSIYHHQQSIEHGNEKQPTFYLLKKEEKPYHLDYCFTSDSLISANTRITIGNYIDWIKLSDHMPLIIENLA